MGGIKSLQTNIVEFDRKPVFHLFIPMIITDMASGLVSIEYGFMGPNFSISTACASSNHSILEAFHIIQRGDADIMVTGGAKDRLPI